MEISDKLLDSALSLSKALNALFVGIVLVSVYLVPRDFAVELGDADISELGKTQAVVQDLTFSFLAMSILWPVVIGALCLLFAQLSNRHLQVFSRLKEEARDIGANDLLLLDPFFLFTSFRESWWQSLTWSFLSYLPLFALMFHALMTVLGVMMALSEQNAPDWLVYKAPIQLALCFLAVPFAIGFANATVSLRHRSDAEPFEDAQRT